MTVSNKQLSGTISVDEGVSVISGDRSEDPGDEMITEDVISGTDVITMLELVKLSVGEHERMK